MVSCLHWFHIMYKSWQVAISLFCPTSSRGYSNTFIISHLPTFFQVMAIVSVTLTKFQSDFQFHWNNYVHNFICISQITLKLLHTEAMMLPQCGKMLLQSDQTFLHYSNDTLHWLEDSIEYCLWNEHFMGLRIRQVLKNRGSISMECA